MDKPRKRLNVKTEACFSLQTNGEFSKKWVVCFLSQKRKPEVSALSNIADYTACGQYAE